jgi:hypothetical protein
MAYTRITERSLVGAAVVLLGLLLLVRTTGVYDTGGLLLYAPSLLVLVGVVSLALHGLRNATGALTLVVVGGLWQTVALGYLTWGEVVAWWPVLLVAFGLSLLVRRVGRAPAATTDDTVGLVALFGGRDQRVASRAFRGGDLTVLFGGLDLDLRDAEPAERPVRVGVTAAFGGVEIAVPRDWNVRMDVVPILGGAEDERRREPRDHDDLDLVVEGFVAFGGVSVTD